MKLNSMNYLSSSSERESADFTFFSPSSITGEKINNTHNLSLSLLQLVKTMTVQIELRTNHDVSSCVMITTNEGPALYTLYLVPASYYHCQRTAQNGPLPSLLSNFNGRIGSALAVVMTGRDQV